MNKVVVGGVVCFAGLAILTLCSHGAGARAGTPTVVLGTFDSRAVLFAYVGSDEFKHYLSEQKTDLDRVIGRARNAGDRALAADLDALGPAVQKRIHQQGFGTAPVDDILERIADRLPAIAEAAGVDVIVSKWDLAYRDPAADVVDVTDALAAEFDPSEETLKGIREIVSQAPVPLDQIEEEE